MNYSEPPIDRHSAQNLKRMLASRMGWDLDPRINAFTYPYSFLHAQKLDDEEAVVFIIQRGTPLVIRDDINLFPSDALVTQLRLLGDEK